MKKRQAFEVAAEIEKKWRSRSGCVLWSWRFIDVQWLLDRWKFKRPQDSERRTVIDAAIHQAIADRFHAGLSMSWLYVCNQHMREMMVGAGLNLSEPVCRESVFSGDVIQLQPRACSGETA